MKSNESILARLLPHITLDSDGCWLCDMSIDRYGYSRVKVSGKMQKAHRVMYILIRGDIPCGLVLDHECARGNSYKRRCINPFHIDVVTSSVNNKRNVYSNQHRSN